MKRTILAALIVFICFSPFVSAQIIPVKNSFQADIASVISDYPNRFKNFLGEILTENPQTTDYRCTKYIKDADECIITRHSTSGKEVYTWQALMTKTENFAEAEKKFRSLYHAVNNLSVMMTGGKIVFKGDYNKPAEDKNFTSILFSPADKKSVWSKLKVELSLQPEMLEWTVRVLVYEREREDDEKGPQKDQ